MERIIYCKTCGHEVPAGNRFCPNCGSMVQEQRNTGEIRFPADPETIQFTAPDENQPAKGDTTLQLPVFAVSGSANIPGPDDPTEDLGLENQPYTLYEEVLETDGDERSSEDEGPLDFLKRKPLVLLAGILVAAALLIAMLLIFSPFGKKEPEPEPTPEPTVEPTPTPEPTPEPEVENKTLGKVTVLTDLNVRPMPSTNGDPIDAVYYGQEFDVYEIKETGEYTWYRIGENRWIADNGTFLRYTPNE